MYIDFILNDIETTEYEAKTKVKEVLDTQLVTSVTVPHFLIKSVRQPIEDHVNVINFSCLIDYPMGVSDPKTRQFAVSQAIRHGINTVDIVMPQNLAANRKYDKIREDIKTSTDICTEKNVCIRYILEYRAFDHHCLKKICSIFDDFGVKYCFPSSGYFIDNLADNIIAGVFLHQNSKNINIIISGNLWTNNHFDTLIKSGSSGFRTNNVFTVKNFAQFNFDRQKNSGV
jgi:deoxyribose-phosphate aldolase